jgi:hypothetical protein
MDGVTAVHVVRRSEDNMITIHNSDVHFCLDQVSLTGTSLIMVHGKSVVTITAVGSTSLLATADHPAAIDCGEENSIIFLGSNAAVSMPLALALGRITGASCCHFGVRHGVRIPV